MRVVQLVRRISDGLVLNCVPQGELVPDFDFASQSVDLQIVSEEMYQYRVLENRLRAIRVANKNADSSDEDSVLDLMDEAWWCLSDEERRILNEEPPSTRK